MFIIIKGHHYHYYCTLDSTVLTIFKQNRRLLHIMIQDTMSSRTYKHRNLTSMAKGQSYDIVTCMEFRNKERYLTRRSFRFYCALQTFTVWCHFL